jgi:hypothetical protein
MNKRIAPFSVAPAQAGIQDGRDPSLALDSRLRGNDEMMERDVRLVRGGE